MAEEVGVLRIGLSLTEADFTASMQQISRRIRGVNSEFNALRSGVDGFDQSLDGMRANSRRYNDMLNLQRSRVEQLREAYDRSVQARGRDARETENLLIRYNNSVTAMRRTEQALNRVNGQINLQSTRLGRLSNTLRDTGERFNRLGSRMRTVGQGMTSSLGVATAAVGAGLGLAAKKAMDFESQMSSVKSVMAPDEVKQFGGELEKLAITMGAKTKYSATEAASGIEELLKSGVSVKDIMNGGLDGALSLATAGTLELKDAAEVASTALNAFKKDNISVMRAADILAGAANASATDVQELKFGLSMVSAVASGVGLTFEETSTTLAAFAQNGLKGSDSGTSLKTMLLNLSPTTKAQTEAFSDLGLATYNVHAGYKFLVDKGIKPASRSVEDIQNGLKQLAKEELGSGASKAKLTKEFERLQHASGLASSAFYDENGHIKSMADIAGTLQKALKGLNDEQRQNYLRTMFGTDAIRAGNILYKEGAQGINNMTTAINKVKSADVAKQKLDNLKGTIEQLKGSLETAGITIGTALIPAFKWVTEKIQAGVTWFNNLSPAMKKTIAIGGLVSVAVLGIGTAIGGLLAVVGGAISGIGAIAGVLAPLTAGLAGAAGGAGLLGGALAILTGPVGIAVAAVAALGVGAYLLNKKMQQPIMTVDLFGDKVSKSTQKAVGAYEDMNDKVTEQLNLLNWSGQAVSQDMANKITGNFQKMGATITGSLKKEFDQSYTTMSTFLQNTDRFTDAEKKVFLDNMQNRYNQQTKVVTDGEAKIKQIMDTASQQKRQLTSAEKTQINTIQSNMQKVAIQTLSNGEVEQKTIMARLKTESSKITAEQAAETVRNSKKATDHAISDADKKYKATIAAIIRERDETGSISKEQADKLITEAKRQHDETVRKAKAMHKKVVSEAKLQAHEHADEIDWETGKVKGGWDQMWDKVKSAWNWISGLFGGGKKRSSPKKSSKSIKGVAGSNKVAGEQTSAYANGTDYHPGGLAIVSEEGRELINEPGKGTYLSGSNGAEVRNLRKGASVLPHKQTEKLLKSVGMPGYAGGIGDAFDWIMKGPKALLDSALNKFGVKDSLLPSWFTNISGSPLTAIKDIGLNWVKNLIPDLSSLGGSFSGAGAAQAKQWILAAMKITGTPMGYLNGLMKIAQKESGFNPKAINLWDSNFKAGHPSKGLFQTIDSTFRSHMMSGMGDIWNPIHNAVAAIRYMNSRYGGISNVPGLRNMAKGGGYVGYKVGGIATQPQIAALAENGYPEYIIPTEPAMRDRAQGLWKQAGKDIGMGNEQGLSSKLDQLIMLLEKFANRPIQPSPVNLDGFEMARILYSYLDTLQNNDFIKTKIWEGVKG
ncbi:phage tail tape measure protein [Peribacillus kribbensis]|uniref:phage tail tape measure protein n=1 Tax=Peribacillus kribbensis TaxID=356658 RepID=UPI0004066243|nr:phage tail tape measure protein [Peribacillus kribbensis]